MKPKHTGFRRLYHATRFSLQGLKAAFVGEAAFRQEVIGVALLLPWVFWLSITPLEKAFLLATLLLLLVVELLNSAIEAAVDRMGSEQHLLSGQAKDMASAAIFVTLLLVVATWGLILGPSFWLWWQAWI
jgi:diacylglycerol kinase (ATP)